MAYMVRWKQKVLSVSPSKVVPFGNFTTSMKLKSDSENDSGGAQSPHQYTRSRTAPCDIRNNLYERIGGRSTRSD